MKRAARVASVDALRDLRTALAGFIEEAQAALTEADHEIQRTLDWLEHDQITYWKGELRHWSEEIARAKSELYRKQIKSRPDEAARSAVDEKKRLEYVLRKRNEAETKIHLVKKTHRLLTHEAMEYRGPTQQLALALSMELPVAAEKLGKLVESLQRYIRLTVPSAEYQITPHPSGPDNNRKNTGNRSSGTPNADELIRNRKRWMKKAVSEELRISLLQNKETVDSDLLGAGAVTCACGMVSDPPATNWFVIAEKYWEQADKLFLVRGSPVTEKDSGWFIGIPGSDGLSPNQEKEASNPTLDVLTVSDACHSHPTLLDIMDLPTGCIALTDGERVLAVTDASGGVIWSD